MKHPERVEDYLEHILEAVQQKPGIFSPCNFLKSFKRTGRCKTPLCATSRLSARL